MLVSGRNIFSLINDFEAVVVVFVDADVVTIVIDVIDVIAVAIDVSSSLVLTKRKATEKERKAKQKKLDSNPGAAAASSDFQLWYNLDRREPGGRLEHAAR